MKARRRAQFAVWHTTSPSPCSLTWHDGLIDSSLVARQQTNEKTLKERHASIPRARPPSPPPPRSLGPAAFYPASTLFALRSVAGISRAHGEGAKQQAAVWEYRRGERAKPKVPRPVRSASAAGSLPGGRHVVRVGAPVRRRRRRRRRTPHSAAGSPLTTTGARALIAAKYPSDDGTRQAAGGTARGPLGRVVFHPLPRVLWFASVRPLPVPAAPARARPPSPNRPDGVSSGARADATTACRLSILLAPEGTDGRRCVVEVCPLPDSPSGQSSIAYMVILLGYAGLLSCSSPWLAG